MYIRRTSSLQVSSYHEVVSSAGDPIMDSAIDLFRAGAPVLAGEIDHAAVSSMRTVCPECMELVHLVVRDTTSFFAHQRRTRTSSPCSLRVESWGSSSHGGGGTHERLPPNTHFQDSLLAAYSLTEAPDAPAGGADPGEAAALMHDVFRTRGRTVTAADLSDASPLVRGWWTADEEMIRSFLDRPSFLGDRLREDLRSHPSLRSEEHRRSVLLLWRQLHLPQVAEDLGLLLGVTAHLFRPLLLADLVVTSLGVLSWVPWTVFPEPDREEVGFDREEVDLDREEADLEGNEVCEECGRSFLLPGSEKRVGCSECTKATLCPDCAIPCSGCGDILCEHCIFRSCPACSGVLCLTCWHFEWECTECGTWFCEGGRDEKPEEVDKVECGDCGEPFCPECVDDALEEWEGDWLCESCLDERQQAAAEE